MRPLLQLPARYGQRQDLPNLQGWRAAAIISLIAGVFVSLPSAAQVRHIAPDQFAPVYSDPNSPAHKPAPRSAEKPAPAPTAPKTASPRPVAPSREKPYGGCDAAAANFAVCLGGAAALADQAVETAERSTVDALGRRGALNPLMLQQFAQSLHSAGDAWRNLRERECADLPLIEVGLAGSLYEKRLECRIGRDIERIEFLRRAYGSAP